MKRITTGLIAFLLTLSLPVIAGQTSFMRSDGASAAIQAIPANLETRQTNTVSRGGDNPAAVAALTAARQALLAATSEAEESPVQETTEKVETAAPEVTQASTKQEEPVTASSETATPAAEKTAAAEQEVQAVAAEEATSAETVEATDEKGTSLGSFVVTAYSDCEICQGKWVGTTATGVAPQAGVTIAVDPKVIPLGTRVYIEGVGWRIAQDTGGAVKGKRIDLFLESYQAALNWGRQTKEVWKE